MRTPQGLWVAGLLCLSALACSSPPPNQQSTTCTPGALLPCDCVFSQGVGTCGLDGKMGHCDCTVRYQGGTDGGASDGQSRASDGGVKDADEVDSTLTDAGPSDTAQPDTAQPDTAQPDTAQPDTAQPDTAQPDTAQPDTAQPDTAQPDTAQPDTAQPDTAQPDAGGPIGGCTQGTWQLLDLAGGSGVGSMDGLGAKARFNAPRGLAFASDGTILVADYSNHRVRRVTSAGVVTTVAGSGVGSTTGPIKSAKFSYPAGVYEETGTIWIAASSNDQIRKISGGQVTVVAGTGTSGSTDGEALGKARFYKPQAVAKAPDGSLWVADTKNHRIRRIASGQVTTVAGSSIGGQDGKGKMARFSFPKDIRFLGSDALVADRHNHKVRRVAADGTVTTYAGTYKGDVDGPLSMARFNEPCGLAVDGGGVVWVADRDNHKIRKVANGLVTTVAGNSKGFSSGPALSAALSSPWGITVSSKGTLYIADRGNNRVRKLGCF